VERFANILMSSAHTPRRAAILTAGGRRSAALLISLLAAAGSAAAQPASAAEQAQTPREGAEVRAGRDGFAVRSADGAFGLRLRGYLQSDSRFYLDDREDATDTFLLRRVRPILEGTLFRHFDFRVMPDFGGGAPTLQDAYIEARLHPLVRIRTGKFKAPIGLERLRSASELTFIERALPTALVPNRDLGIAVHGEWRTGTLIYMAGVFNGTVDGGSSDDDGHDGKDVAARLFAHPFRADRRAWMRGLGVGLAGSYGVERGTQIAPGLPVLRTSGQQAFFRFRLAGVAGGPAVADGARYRVSPQGSFFAGSTGVVLEHVLSAQEIRRSASTLTARSTAWQAAASLVLTGEAATPRGVTPARPFDRDAGGWGAFEVAARYSALGVSDDLFPMFADLSIAARRARAAAVGLNWYLNANVKVSATYERTAFDGGAPGGDRAVEHDLFTRFQIAF
jgi:phosphate-selective porin OprO/OprP